MDAKSTSIPPLIIDGALTNPPSQIYSFRTLTLVFYKKTPIILECPEGFKDRYWYWLKKVNPGAWDCVSDLVHYSENVEGFRIQAQDTGLIWSIVVDRINEKNLNQLISGINFFLF